LLWVCGVVFVKTTALMDISAAAIFLCDESAVFGVIIKKDFYNGRLIPLAR